MGPVREFNGLKGYWMGLGLIPKDAKVKEPGWLTYRRSPIERLTEITFGAGKPVFILDDPDGKPWVMKSYRDDYGQTYESLSTLGERYKQTSRRLEVPGGRAGSGPGSRADQSRGNGHDHAGRVREHLRLPRRRLVELPPVSCENEDRRVAIGEMRPSQQRGAVMSILTAKLPQDDAGAKLMRFEGIRGQRYTEIFLIGGNAIIATSAVSTTRSG